MKNFRLAIHEKLGPLAAALVPSVAGSAQTSRGTLTGTVLDPTGAVNPGVQMTLTGVDTGVRLSTLTNEAGVYRFDAVDLGVYDLTAAHPGFQTYSATAINVEANRVTTLDPRLELGAAETRIEVSGETSEPLVKDSPLRLSCRWPGGTKAETIASQQVPDPGQVRGGYSEKARQKFRVGTQ